MNRTLQIFDGEADTDALPVGNLVVNSDGSITPSGFYSHQRAREVVASICDEYSLGWVLYIVPSQAEPDGVKENITEETPTVLTHSDEAKQRAWAAATTMVNAVVDEYPLMDDVRDGYIVSVAEQKLELIRSQTDWLLWGNHE